MKKNKRAQASCEEDQTTAQKGLFANFAKRFGKNWQKKLQGALCCIYDNLYFSTNFYLDNKFFFEKYFYLTTIGKLDYLLLKSLEKHKDFFKQTLEEGHKMRDERIKHIIEERVIRIGKI